MGFTGLDATFGSTDATMEAIEECAKLGLTTVIAPDGTTSRGGPRVTRAETLRQAIAAGLEAAAAAEVA